MNILIKKQFSSLCNQDIKWYLSDEKLWITKCNDYADIEKSIERLTGSFNWLYEINDTVLFNKTDGKFETAIIDLSGKIRTGELDDSFILMKKEEKGDLFLIDKRNCNFVFPSSVIYVKNRDYLIALPINFEKQDLGILFIVDDFGFIIMNNQLKGWILKNASKHVCVSQTNGKISDNNPDFLEMYLNALNLWEAGEEDATELEKLLEGIKTRKDTISLAIKESIINILS